MGAPICADGSDRLHMVLAGRLGELVERYVLLWYQPSKASDAGVDVDVDGRPGNST